MKRYFLFVVIFFFSFNMSYAQNNVPSSDEVLKLAYQQAAKEKKKVFVIFHASWCGWCRKMDSSINDASVKPFFDKNYVVTHLTVQELPHNKSLENPGAEQFLNNHGGEGKGLPFWIVLDKDGNTLGDSQVSRGVNSGCPSSEAEVAHLLEVLDKTSNINAKQKIAVEKRFRKNQPS